MMIHAYRSVLWFHPRMGERGSAAVTARWNSPEWLEPRRVARLRKIKELVSKFPVTPEEAEQLRALLPPEDGAES
jgi:hypothetical protein